MKIVSAACLAGLLWLTGCATTTPDPADTSATASQTGKTPQAPLPRPYTPFFPDGPLQPITAAQAAAMGVAATAPPADMWERIRRGFAMPNLETDQVSDQEQWYATRPDYMQRMTERSSKYLFHIVEELEMRGMPTELALLPYIESAFNPQAVSSVKAAGMWQFMPATGTDFQLKQNAFRDDRRDVLASTKAALDYLQRLHGMFGDWHLALAAYNWGQGNVGRAIARNQKAGLPTGYLDINMPAETRMYVPKLQAVKNIVANPQRYRTELPLIENHPYFQTVLVTRDIDVELAAKLADVRIEDFKALNPSMHRPVIMAAGTPRILLPWDNAAVFQRNFEAHTKGQYASWTAWTVPSNMSVSAISQRVGMSESDLRSMNNIPPNMLVRAGSALIVPRSATNTDVTSHVADNGQMSLAPEIVTRRTVVKAHKKENTASIARRYRVSVADVANWNDVSASSAFKVGEQVVLYLPVRAGSKASSGASRSSSAKVRASTSSKSTASASRSTSAGKKSAAAPAKRGGEPAKKKR